MKNYFLKCAFILSTTVFSINAHAVEVKINNIDVTRNPHEMSEAVVAEYNGNFEFEATLPTVGEHSIKNINQNKVNGNLTFYLESDDGTGRQACIPISPTPGASKISIMVVNHTHVVGPATYPTECHVISHQ